MKLKYTVILLIAITSTGAHAADRWWDADASAGVGGSAIWGTTFSTTATGTALTTAATEDDTIFAGTAGTVTLGANQTANSLAFSTTGYTITTSGTSTRVLAGGITLANNVTLSLSPLAAAPLTTGTITGGTSSAITVAGAAVQATDTVRINLASGSTVAASAPITISTTGSLGLSGFVANGGTATINAGITNNSGVTTMLGATSGNTLTIGGVVSGSAGVQFSASTSGGAGTINLNTAATYTGATLFNGTASGSVKLGVNDALPTSTAVTMGFSSGNGQRLDLNGFNQTIASLASNTGGTGSIVNNANGTGTNTLTINGSTSATFGLVIANGTTAKTALTRAGSGSTTLSGDNTYTGTTTIDGGILAVNGSLDLSSAVTVNSGGTLGGSGTVNGAVTVKSGGIVGPGNSPGVLTTGAASFENSSIFSWELNSDVDRNGTLPDGTRGTNYDGLTASSLSVASGAVFRVILTETASSDLSSNFWNTNQIWNNIFSVSGSTTNSEAGKLFNAFQVYNGSTDITTASAVQGSFSFTNSTLNWTAVPEPTSALAGLLITAGLLRRRRVA